MASPSDQLAPQPLRGGDYASFNWVFLIEYILCGILCLWFLFYFNRIFATLISYAIRLFTWHRFGVYVDIEALQISLLAGRVFFKGIRYHGDNETIFIHGGYITWRYWLRKVKKASFIQARKTGKGYSRTAVDNDKGLASSSESCASEESDSIRDDNLPCRIEIRVSGVEAFIYNRSPAYDWILESCDNNGSSTTEAHAEDQSPSRSGQAGHEDIDLRQQENKPNSSTSSFSSRPDVGSNSDRPEKPEEPVASKNQQCSPPSPPSFLRLLPVYVHCNKAAAVLGNEGTPAILTAKINSADGTFDASEAGPLDIFKILMQFQVHKPFIQMKPNIDFKREQLTEAALLDPLELATADRQSIASEKGKARKESKRGWSRLPGISKKAMESLESVAKLPRLSTNEKHLPDTHYNLPGQERWLGLTRYLDDTQCKDEDEWKVVEYAKASTLADLTCVDFKFFWDITGPRTSVESDIPHQTGPATSSTDINRDYPPDYGMDLHVHGGQVHYGPWADRHRVHLQQLFFPAPFADAKPTFRVRPGDPRICSIFKLFISIESDTILRIPFREPSKDYKWKGRNQTTTQRRDGNERKKTGRRRNTNNAFRSTHARAYAWFDIKVRPNSTINFKQDMYPSLAGYRNDLRVDVSGIDIYSSLNHALLWSSGKVTVNADLSYPLQWNGLREWQFDIGIFNLDFYLLRDHTFLLMDLIEDWTTGPFPEFLTFVPYRYILKPTFESFNLFLNVNDANIIDRSDEIDDNDFVILYGRDLVSELSIPIDRFRPPTNEICFDVVAHDLGFRLSMPPKNTLHTFLADKDVAQLPEVNLKGSYVLCSEVRPGLVEQLNMEIIGRGLRIAFYGFFARQLAKIKENYFGDDIHFRTLQEYQELARSNFQSNEPLAPIRGNDLDVILDIVAEDAHIMLPARLYSCKEFVELFVDSANVDLRVNNYYLELMVDSSPLQLSSCSRSISTDSTSYKLSKPQITIDSVNVYGHRLFGLQPSEPAYVSNWDIQAGDILGDCSSEFVAKVASAAQALALTITDEENGLPIAQTASIYDTTFVRWRSSLICLWVNIQNQKFSLRAENISGSFNDFARDRTSQHLVLAVPEIVIACVGLQDLKDEQQKDRLKDTQAYLKTAANVKMMQRAPNLTDLKQGQRKHIAEHDERTGRASFLIGASRPATQTPPVSLCLPSLPKLLDLSDQLSPSKLTTMDGIVDERLTLIRRSSLEDFKGLVFDPEVSTPKRAIISTTSLFGRPSFPLTNSDVDLREVPNLPSSAEQNASHPNDSRENLFDLSSDEDTLHTSVIIQVTPGIVLMCKPQAILAVARILQAVAPVEPEAAFDQYQIENTMGVLSLLKKQRRKKLILDLGINLPFMHARLINTAIPLNAPGSDEYNVVSTQVITAVRIKSIPDRKHADDLKAVHLTVSSLKFSASQLESNPNTNEGAFNADVKGIFLWLAQSDKTLVNGSYDSLQIAVASNELAYLTGLIHRALLNAGPLAKPFIDIQARNAQRRRFIAYHLSQRSDNIPDPSFLIRPAYMIRSAQDHLRNSDSWKVVARLRWILCCLSRDDEQFLWDSCINDATFTPPHDEEIVLNTLDQWRSWDAVHVKDSLAMKLLFGHRTETTKTYDSKSVPLSISVRGTRNRVSLDRGELHNEVQINGLTVAATANPPPPPSAMEIFHEYRESRSVVLHLGTSDASMNLNWDLCNLVDELILLFQSKEMTELLSLQSNGMKSATDTSENQDDDERAKEEIHVVLQLDNAEIRVRAINLEQRFKGQDLKISLTGSGIANPSAGSILSLAASANLVSMSTSRNARIFLESRLGDPSLLFSFEDPSPRNSDLQAISVTGNALNFTLESDEDLTYYLETVDLVLRHEAVHINQIVKKHATLASEKETVTGSPPSHAKSVQLHLALLLDSYKFHITLFQDLQYIADGKVLRLSIQPERKETSSHKVDFDLKEQTHTLWRGSVTQPLATSIIEMPPINGTVRVLKAGSLITLSSTILVEQIHLEAIALYAISSMLNTSGATQAVESMKQDIYSLQHTTSTLFPPAAGREEDTEILSNPAKEVVFDASLRLAGFSVSAHTHPKTSDDLASEVVFSLQSTHFRTANRDKNSDRPLPFPEFQIALGRLGMKVERQNDQQMVPSASLAFALQIECTVNSLNEQQWARNISLHANGPAIEIDERTSPTVVSILSHFQERLKNLDLSKEKQYLRRLRQPERDSFNPLQEETSPSSGKPSKPSFVTSFDFRLRSAYVMYNVHKCSEKTVSRDAQNLAFSLKEVTLVTHGEKEARLRIDELKLQLLPEGSSWTQRHVNSSLLPEIIFTVNHQTSKTDRRLLFRAAGKALDIQFHPNVVKPAAELEKSLVRTANMTRSALLKLRQQPSSSNLSAPKLSLGSRRLTLFVIDASFAGAVIRLLEHDPSQPRTENFSSISSTHLGRFSNLSSDSVAKDAVLRAPGIAIRIQHDDPVDSEPLLNAEIRIDESDNVLTPAIVPLILRIAHNVKVSIRDDEARNQRKDETQYLTLKQPSISKPPLETHEPSIIQRNPRALLGRTRLNIGMHISKQQFALICQPIAKVEARMKLEDTYLSICTVDSGDDGNFFALSATFAGLQASLQHVYSRDPTFKFDMESIVVSVMNSKHISGTTGISAMLKINPMRAHLNAKQLQDILLFREIWLPPEIRDASIRNPSPPLENQHEYFVARYRQIAASAAFPWNATVAIADLGIELDLGQAIGKLSSHISNLWASSKKTTSSHQTLSVGIGSVSANATGRMSGFLQLNSVKVRTSIAWPSLSSGDNQTPLVQGSVGFKELRLKAAFDYQIFAISHITSFEFIMYNVRDRAQRSGDRLVAILDGDKIHVYCVASTAALAVSLGQAFERLIQERKASYEQSLKDIDAFLRRKTTLSRSRTTSQTTQPVVKEPSPQRADEAQLPISLHTDVVVTLRAVDVGAFPRTVMDNQILRLVTSDVQARFAVAVEDDKLHSGLSLTLGQVRAALASVPHAGVPKALGDVEIDEVVRNATSAKGGVILRVPKVVAAMQTWQKKGSRTIEYKFKSVFEGKIDVGWNYSRISFIRSMWATHWRTLATRLGKPLPQSALKISGPQPLPEDAEERAGEPGMTRTEEQQKITVTANVDLPQSGYTYYALEPAVIDTPQLRDMGEATPPLEWIGLHRDKLPNVTHQIIIVTLLELTKEVEDTYGKILGSA